MESNGQKRKVSLVLGSGGARGITQIGVINYLEEQGYVIDEVVGCSIGALVGAAYAEGKLQDLALWMRALTKMQVFKLMDFSDPRYGLLKGSRVLDSLQAVFKDTQIEDLPIAYTAVATDLKHEREILFRQGSVYAAIRASIAIPGLFTGIDREDEFLVDGGVLNPIPINHVQHTSNLVIAVNLDGIPDFTKVVFPKKLNTIALMQESYYAMRRRLSTLSIALYKPDYVIHVPHNISGIWDFDRSTDLIEQGYLLAKAALADDLDLANLK